MSQFLFESKHGKVWRNPVTGGHSCESRDVNALAGELAEALSASEAAREIEQANHANLQECWDRSCAHVKEALELLGVDVSPEGYIPDTWTLREQCHIAKGRLDTLRSQLAAAQQRVERLEKALKLLPDPRWGSKTGRPDYSASVGGDVLLACWQALTESEATDG